MKKLSTSCAGLVIAAIILGMIGFSSCSGPEFTLGRWDGDVYTNEMLSLNFNIPSGWHLADTSEASELIGTDRLVFSDMAEKDLKTYEKDKDFTIGYAFVMAASNGEDRFDMIYQKNTEDADAASYIASIKSQLESYNDIYEITEVSSDTVTIAGHEYSDLEMKLESENNLLRYYYLTTSENGYFITMVVTTSLENYSFSSFVKSLG